MSPEVQARIFDPFFSTKSAGRGLGLPVLQGIVRSLRGAIRVDSRVGKGTTVQILLPSWETAAHAACSTGAGSERELHRTPHATVLLVEDEAPLRFALKKMLEKAGFTVLEAADGFDAVKLLHHKCEQIDVLFLDMTIPGCSSHQVLSEAVQACPQVKVILTSAYGEEMVRANLSGPQVCGFVRKPFQTRYSSVDIKERAVIVAAVGYLRVATTGLERDRCPSRLSRPQHETLLCGRLVRRSGGLDPCIFRRDKALLTVAENG